MEKQQKQAFIKLTQDLMFQTFFKLSSRCLLSLLNAFIPMPKGKTITKAYILDSFSPSDFPEGKLSIMDIKASWKAESLSISSFKLPTKKDLGVELCFIGLSSIPAS